MVTLTHYIHHLIYYSLHLRAAAEKFYNIFFYRTAKRKRVKMGWIAFILGMSSHKKFERRILHSAAVRRFLTITLHFYDNSLTITILPRGIFPQHSIRYNLNTLDEPYCYSDYPMGSAACGLDNHYRISLSLLRRGRRVGLARPSPPAVDSAGQMAGDNGMLYHRMEMGTDCRYHDRAALYGTRDTGAGDIFNAVLDCHGSAGTNVHFQFNGMGDSAGEWACRRAGHWQKHTRVLINKTRDERCIGVEADRRSGADEVLKFDEVLTPGLMYTEG
jgi:hypothetical protein